nr:MAG TPA: thiol-disulfide oxidoreductase [Caudoviricetes sp.]
MANSCYVLPKLLIIEFGTNSCHVLQKHLPSFTKIVATFYQNKGINVILFILFYQW